MKRRLLYWTILVTVCYLALEGSSYVGLAVLEKNLSITYSPAPTERLNDEHRQILKRVVNGEAQYVRYSPTLGWTTNGGGSTELYHANSQGIRGTTEYAFVPAGDRVRLAAFGDSFTHGNDVADNDAWTAVLQSIDSTLEVLNFGVGGYGLDQAYLRYGEQGVGFNPKIVLIGFMSENINRHVSVFRPFYAPRSGKPLTKPHFELENGKLKLVENPMRNLADYRRLLDKPASVLTKLGSTDYFYHFRYKEGPLDFSPSVRLTKMLSYEIKERFDNPIYIDGEYNTEAKAYKVTARLFDEFHSTVLKNGALPIVLLFPSKNALKAHRESDKLPYRPLIEHFKSRNYFYIELAHGFEMLAKDIPVDELCIAHYTPLGNRIVAQYVLSYLKEHGFTDSLVINKTIGDLIRAQVKLVDASDRRRVFGSSGETTTGPASEAAQ